MFAESALDESAELDRCIDDLLMGQQWEPGFPPGPKRTEVAGLMRVAELLVVTAREAPRGGGERKQRVWRRVWRALAIRALVPVRGATRRAGVAWYVRTTRPSRDWPGWPSASPRSGATVRAVHLVSLP